MYILGINAYHAGSSACLIKDGQLVAAAEEERFRRIKYWAGFPCEAINFCLKTAGINAADLDHIGISRDPNASLHIGACDAAMRLLLARSSDCGPSLIRSHAASPGRDAGRQERPPRRCWRDSLEDSHEEHEEKNQRQAPERLLQLL